MKVLQFGVFSGGLVAAVSAFAPNDGFRRSENEILKPDAVTTITLLATEWVTQTQCGTATNCPTDGIVFVTSIVKTTTTVCPLTNLPYFSGSVPGFPGYSTLPVSTTAVATSGPQVTTSNTPSGSWSSELSQATSASSSSMSSANPSDTATDSVPTSLQSLSSGYQPSSVVSSGNSSMASSAEATNPGSVSTSIPVSMPGSSSVISEASSSTLKQPVPSSQYAPPPSPSSLSDVATTIRVTSTSAFTSYITKTLPPSSSSNATTVLGTSTSILTLYHTSMLSSGPDTSSTIEARPTSIGTSASGYPSSGWPNATINGTVVFPSPTLPLPVNNFGQKITGTDKSSMMAIVVALAFAHLA